MIERSRHFGADRGNRRQERRINDSKQSPKQENIGGVKGERPNQEFRAEKPMTDDQAKHLHLASELYKAYRDEEHPNVHIPNYVKEVATLHLLVANDVLTPEQAEERYPNYRKEAKRFLNKWAGIQ